MIQDIQALASQSTADSGALMQMPRVSIRMAIAFVAILPRLMVAYQIQPSSRLRLDISSSDFS